MGKSKKTRWRALDLDGGSQDETLSSDAAVEITYHNGNSDSSAPTGSAVTSHKYSQILGDHHNTANNNSTSTTGFNGKSSSSFPFNSYNRSKSYNNKENYYNQRIVGGGRSGAHKSWQRSGSYRSTFNGKDKDIKRPEENLENAGSKDTTNDSTVSEPKRFNEDEYTRITTPRQDVLFKKGYLSRNINKTATIAATANNSLSTTSNSTETTASSTATTSDPESSVSTLSPATTPSMDYGNQPDSLEGYGQPMYYPGYPGYMYDESGMLVFPVPFNGYQPYFSPSPGSPGSPMILMPYSSYPYDPFFMPPEGVDEPTEADGEQLDDKVNMTAASDGNESNEKESNDQENEESNHNGVIAAETTESASSSPISTSDAGATESNNHEEDGGDEAEEEDEDSKKQGDDQIDGIGLEENIQNLAGDDLDNKHGLQYYPTDYGNFIYPAYPNNFYNNGYFYYNDGQLQRPPKMKRRKRYPSYRNQPRSTETTTDDENTSLTKFNGNSNYKYQSNGWSHPKFFFERSQRDYLDQNRNVAFNGSHLNAEVKEFYPQTKAADEDPRSPVDVTTKVDDTNNNNVKQVKTENSSKAAKPSQLSTVKTQKVTKREIMQGIKSMEQQNIDLMATKHTLTTNASQDDDEWNVIMKGKKVKIIRDESSSRSKSSSVAQDVKNVENKVEAKNVAVESTTATINASSPPAMSIQTLENVKKSSSSVTTKGTNNSKKSKNKGKKKKSHMMVKQDGFEIIEPEFAKPLVTTTSSINEFDEDEIEKDENMLESSDIETETLVSEETVIQVTENQVLLNTKNIEKSDECIKEESADDEKSEIGNDVVNATIIGHVDECQHQVQPKTIIIEKSMNDLTKAQQEEDIDTVIDISDEDICSSKVLISLEKEIKDILDVSEASLPKSSTSIEAEVRNMTNDLMKKSPEVHLIEPQPEPEDLQSTLEASEFFNDRVNFADLERDVIENLKQLGADEDIELKSPIINPLYDFPITSAVQKWLQAKQNESFDSLFHVQNLKKLSEIYEDNDDEEEDDEKAETESDISEKEMKSETDSDYASDFHAKTNGNSPKCSNHAKVSVRSLNSKLIATKESFCALM